MIRSSLLRRAGVAVLAACLFGFSPVLAYASGNGDDLSVSDVSGRSTETGTSVHNFVVDAVSYNAQAGEIKYDTVISYTTDGKTVQTAKFGDYMKNRAGVSDDVLRGVLNSKTTVFLTDKHLSASNGSPVFYAFDGTEKTVNDFLSSSMSPAVREAIKKMYGDVDGDWNGELSKGTKGTTFLYSENPSSKDRKDREKSEKRRKLTPNVDPGNPVRNPVQCTYGDGAEFYRSATVDEGYGVLDGVYAVYAKVTPVKPHDFGKLSGEQQAYWNRTHSSQMVGPVKTAWGRFLDANRDTLNMLRAVGKSGGIGEGSNYRRLWDDFERGAKNAIAQGSQDLSVNFSASNQEGFGKGGAFTYTLLEKRASVSTVHSQDLYDQYGCVERSEVKYRWFGASKQKYDNYPGHKKIVYFNGNPRYMIWDSYVDRYTQYEKVGSNKKLDGQFTKGDVLAIMGSGYSPKVSYQMLSVRCNVSEFRRVAANTGSAVLKASKGSSTARSPMVRGGVATFYNGLGTDFFYSGRDCDDSFQCTNERNPNAAGDARNNMANTGNIVGGLYGAQADGKNSSRFVFFRDNLSNEVRNDVWWLKPWGLDGSLSLNSNADAVATYLVLDKSGTPGGETFALEDSNGKVIIDGKDINSRWYWVSRSQQNRFKWRASWASEAGKPHRANILYAYMPDVSVLNVGTFNSSGGSTFGSSNKLDMLCTVNYNTTRLLSPFVYNQPKNLEFNPITRFVDAGDKYVEVNFVKSSAE